MKNKLCNIYVDDNEFNHIISGNKKEIFISLQLLPQKNDIIIIINFETKEDIPFKITFVDYTCLRFKEFDYVCVSIEEYKE